MGRRSINTTKSGKYMNPTDQARKEARKKELKKNKKQRQMVRAAVLKGKDPQQLIVDLEKIDQMEYNVLQPSPLNEKVLKDKRKKLKDTLDRVLKMYNKDDPEKWSELRRFQVEYERKRATLFNYYEAVKNAQQVQIDEIPLPINSLPPELQAAYVGMPSQIPLPPHILRPDFPAPHSILKKSSSYLTKEHKKDPPGVPPGPPPDLEEFGPSSIEAVEGVNIPSVGTIIPQKKSIRFADEHEKMIEDTIMTEGENVSEENAIEDREGPIEENVENETSAGHEGSSRPTSLQQRMLAMAGQNIDEFMKEMDQVNAKRRADRAADLDARLQSLEPEKGEMPGKSLFSSETIATMMNTQPETLSVPGLGSHPLGVLAGMPPMMFRPPPRGVPSLMGIRLPPGPPPGLPPRMGIRLPPGPPPGLPPRLLRPPNLPTAAPPTTQANVLSAAPQLINRPEPGPTTIQAQAQIRSLSADVTRFLPTALRVRRDEKAKPKIKTLSAHEPTVEIHQPILKPGQTKDDAYQQFMREMEGLM